MNSKEDLEDFCVGDLTGVVGELYNFGMTCNPLTDRLISRVLYRPARVSRFDGLYAINLIVYSF